MISKLILVLPTLVTLMGIMLKKRIASVRAQLKHLKVVVLTEEMPALLRNPRCRTVDTIIIIGSEVVFPSLTLVLGTPVCVLLIRAERPFRATDECFLWCTFFLDRSIDGRSVSVISESELDRSVVGVVDPDDHKQTIREVDPSAMMGVGDMGLPGQNDSTQSSASSEYVISLTCSTRRPSIVPWRTVPFDRKALQT